jgi:diguanylate cyclase (GGDEF)-like protein
MEFMTLYLIPLSVSVLLYTTHTNIVTVWQRLLIIINSLLPATILVMHLLNIIHINHFVSPFQIVVLVEIVIMLPPLFIGLNKEHKERLSSETYTGVDADSYLLLGFIILILFALLEIGKYNFIKFTGYTDRLFTSINYLTLGILYFIFCLFIYYFLYSIDSINSNYINKQLAGLAFTDTLTGLMNRAKCMQYFTAIEVPYAVVSLDLDNLKYVNDNYGHAEGDKMLRSFALLLEKAFPTASILGRVGGDEFLVAIENPSDNICDKCIRDLEDYMDNFNDGIEKFTLSASCGYAYSKEIPGAGFEEIFFLADSRMYEMKEKHHA